MESYALEKSTNQAFLQELHLKFDGLSEFVILLIGFSENHFDYSL